MTLNDLIILFGIETRDTVEPYLFPVDERMMWLDEAVEEACLRKNLLFDDSTAAICTIDVTTPTYSYDLHEAINHITEAHLIVGTEYFYLNLVSRDELDQIRPGWREDSVDEPKYLVVDENSVRLVPPPANDGTLQLEVYRVPVESEYMSVSSGKVPVIAATHHKWLVHWAVFKALGRPDADYYHPEGAQKALNAFENYFGRRPDADRLRKTRENRPHRNKLWI